MITDLVQIRMLGEKKRDENEKFRKHMKSRDYSDRILRRLGEEIENQIDCTTCANCCRVATTQVTDRDIERIAKHLRIPVSRVIKEFTQPDTEEGGRNLKWEKGKGCVFLEGNLCSIYDARPDICQRYPHIIRGNGSIASRMWRLVERTTYCPIVYNWIEKVKDDIGLR